MELTFLKRSRYGTPGIHRCNERNNTKVFNELNAHTEVCDARFAYTGYVTVVTGSFKD